MVEFNPSSISITTTKKSYTSYPNGSYANTFLGSGNLGPDVMTRIFMALKSGINSEIKWALSTVCLLSFSSPGFINFEKFPFLGTELIKYFIQPFKVSTSNRTELIERLNFSLDSLLTLRNASQDLINQQWLSLVKNLKKNIITVLKTLIGWYYLGTTDSTQSSELYGEGFNYLLDLIETLSCYYIDNTKTDLLFHYLISILSYSRDKYVIISVVKSLGHLLIIRGNEEITSNCIDSISNDTLEQLISFFLLNDEELSYAVLQFLKEYLSSEAINQSYPTIKESQQWRLEQLLNNNSNVKILMKQLPRLIITNLPLNDPKLLPQLPSLSLTKRSLHSSVPTLVPELSLQLYDIIVKFHEPLRASTWLRCCYEPVYTNNTTEGVDKDLSGEVTQISLWKAYEKQFDKVWQTKEGEKQPAHSQWPKLLPAVDFIKNVSAAFPHSQAMVVNIEPEEPGQQPKRKFIIKGIQPRQFVVNIDVGNYDALKQKPRVATDSNDDVADSSLPIGHVDVAKFDHGLDSLSSYITSNGLNKEHLPSVNMISLELMEYIIASVLEKEGDSHFIDIFRDENLWLKDWIYANPSLIDGGIFSEKWLEYLV